MKRRRRRRTPVDKMMLFLIVFVVSATGLCVVLERIPGKRRSKGTIQSSEVKAAEPEGVRLDKTEVEQAEMEQTEQKENVPIDDRSNFAVQPQVPVGTTEPTEEKIVYLTFDDGPSKNTQPVLDILDKYNAKAAFFVTHGKPEYMGLVKTAYEKGHTIGLHTYTHDYQQVYASVDAYFQDLNAIGQAVQEQIGYVPCFIRFPGGASNTVSANYSSGIMSVLAQEVQSRGYQYYDWNVSSGDGANRTTPEIRTMATGGTQNNIVLLCHDSDNKATTVEALPDIIEFYKNAGYEFRAIDRESFVPHHGISN